MSSKKVISYIIGLLVGLLAVAPPIGYKIPVIINSYSWLYMFTVSALLGVYLIFTKIPTTMKVLSIYLLVGCFISQAPYVSFNAYILCVGAMYCFLWVQRNDFTPIIDMVCAAFFVQVIFTTLQLFGMDKLLNFDKTTPVFVGTILQYMRFSSLLAIMTPILVLKNKKFIFLIMVLAVLSQSLSFALSVILGITAYFLCKHRRYIKVTLISSVVAMGAYCIWDRVSISVAITCGRVSVWADIIRTICYDTLNCKVPIKYYISSCSIDWKAIIFGRGLDTFLPLFPIFKHDLNPFPQAHNCWLQLWFEIGLIGLSILSVYYVKLLIRLKKNPILVGGLICMGVNMFFAFPTRMTQTMLMMVVFLAYCERKARQYEAI